MLTFNGSNVLGASESRNGTNLDLEADPVEFENGWGAINFFFSYELTPGGERVLVAGDNIFGGLPAIGFAVQRYVNGDVLSDIEDCDDDVCVEPPIATPQIRANYAGSINHKGQRLIAEDID